MLSLVSVNSCALASACPLEDIFFLFIELVSICQCLAKHVLHRSHSEVILNVH